MLDSTAHDDNANVPEPLRKPCAWLLHRWRALWMRKFVAQTIGLAPNAAAGFIVERQSVRVTCLSGCLWVTCQDDLRDYVLSAGKDFVPRSGGRLVVQAAATSPARFLVQRSVV